MVVMMPSSWGTQVLSRIQLAPAFTGGGPLSESAGVWLQPFSSSGDERLNLVLLV